MKLALDGTGARGARTGPTEFAPARGGALGNMKRQEPARGRSSVRDLGRHHRGRASSAAVPMAAIVVLLALLAVPGSPVGPRTHVSTPPEPGAVGPIGGPASSAGAGPGAPEATDSARAVVAAGPPAPSPPPQNSSPFPEVGTDVGVASVGADPQGMAYDPLDGYLYVADRGNDTLSVLNGTALVATIAVGSEPTGVVYDPADHLIYVTNFASDNVSVVIGTSLLGTIRNVVFDGPSFPAYDALDGNVYVPNSGDATVTLLNGTDVLQTFPTGNDPYEAAYNPSNGYVYVSNGANASNGGSTLTVLQNLSVVTTLSGSYANPAGMVFDPQNGYLYVSNRNVSSVGGGFVTVLYNVTVFDRITVGPELWGMAYDPVNHLVYAAANDIDESAGNVHANSLAVITTTFVAAYIGVGKAPIAVAYDPAGALVYTTNSQGANVTLISTALGIGPTSMSPIGDPTSSADVGQTLQLASTLWAVGTGHGTFAVSWVPSGSLACGAATQPPGGILSVGPINRTCVALGVGSVSLWLNITDGTGGSVWSEVGFRVFSLPGVSPPLPTPATVDVGQSVSFASSVKSSGSGNVVLRWNVSASLACSTSTTLSLACLATSPNSSALVNLSITDSNGGRTTSLPGTLRVWADPQVSAPALSNSVVPLGGRLTISTTVTGGSGGLVYSWYGLPPPCVVGPTGNSTTCFPNVAGTYRISVSVTDSDGVNSSSGAATLTVSPTPVSTSNTILGVAPAIFYGVIAAVVVVAFAAALAVRWRRGRAS